MTTEIRVVVMATRILRDHAATNTATVRAGTCRVPVAGSADARLTTGSVPAAWTGCSVTGPPRRAGTVCAAGYGVALNTTTVVTGPVTIIVSTPGVSDRPDSGNDTRRCTSSAVDRPNAGEVARMRSRSAYAAEAWSIASQPGTRAGSASNGRAYSHLSLLS